MYDSVEKKAEGTTKETGDMVVESFKRLFPSTMSIIISAEGNVEFFLTVSNVSGPSVRLGPGTRAITNKNAAFLQFEEFEAPIDKINVHIRSTESKEARYSINTLYYMRPEG